MRSSKWALVVVWLTAGCAAEAAPELDQEQASVYNECQTAEFVFQPQPDQVAYAEDDQSNGTLTYGDVVYEVQASLIETDEILECQLELNATGYGHNHHASINVSFSEDVQALHIDWEEPKPGFLWQNLVEGSGDADVTVSESPNDVDINNSSYVTRVKPVVLTTGRKDGDWDGTWNYEVQHAEDGSVVWTMPCSGRQTTIVAFAALYCRHAATVFREDESHGANWCVVPCRKPR